jgi:phage terminase large subunit-like protein
VVLGLFKIRGIMNVIVLDCWKEYLAYPALRRKVRLDIGAQYGESDNLRKADLVLIEKKGSGITLIQDLEQVGVHAHPYDPNRDDKVTRLQAATSYGNAGLVWLIESNLAARKGHPVKAQEEFMRDMISVGPSGDDWDYADAFSQAILYFSTNRMIEAKIATGEEEEKLAEYAPPRRHPYGG